MEREEKKALKKQQIFETALQLFLDKGFKNVTTAEIAENSGIAKKTLFQYFKTKSDIIFDDENHLLSLILDHFTSRQNSWYDFKSFVTQAAQTDLLTKVSANELKIPDLIVKTPELHNRLLIMWEHYEKSISKKLIQFNMDPLEAKLMAQDMVFILKESFIDKASIPTLLQAVELHRNIAN